MDSNLGDKHSPDDTEPKAFTPTNTLDIKAEKELEQFAESNERYRSQILKQKQEYQKMLPIGVAFIAAFFIFLLWHWLIRYFAGLLLTKLRLNLNTFLIYQRALLHF